MKTTLFKKMGWLGMLVCFFNQAYTQPQNELLLPYLLHDSVATKTTVHKDIPASIVPLQSNLQRYVDHYLDINAEALQQIN